ncbi:MAG: hypothetical protein K2L12_04030 [Clostridia bacterium]|nr:hypothetical protein [Clostridia bacterium]
MQETTAKKLNPYITPPQSLFGNGKRRFPFGAIFVGGLIHSYSGELLENGELSDFTRTKAAISKRIGRSYSTVWRAIKFLVDNDKVKLVESKQNTYIFEYENSFIRIDERLLTDEFNIYDEETKKVKERRKLSDVEILVGGLIITRCDNSKHTVKTYEASNKDIADELGISESSVDPAIRVLKAAKIIVRKTEDVGVNRYKKSKYSINRKYRRIIKEQQKDEQESQPGKSEKQPEVKNYKTFRELREAQETERLAQIVARDNKYYESKHAAEDTAERNYAKAMTDAQFRAAENELKSLDIEVAKAEVLNGAIPEELKARHIELIKQRRAALKRLGLSEKDLTVPDKYKSDARGAPGKA